VSSHRRLIRSSRTLVALLLAMTLALRVLVPAGYMPDSSGGSFSVVACDGFGAVAMSKAMPGMHHGKVDHGQTQQRCAFADLALPWLGSIDPIQLLAALAFILAIAFVAAEAFHLRREYRAWPPLRGPPARA
jgi:hypothetical protein